MREEFLTEYVFPSLKAGAIYEIRYLLGTPFARTLIAKYQVKIAHKEKADALCHGATGKGNDQVRFELAYQALAPELTIIAPWREWGISSRQEAMDYAKEHGIKVEATVERPYSRDKNIWHLSHEGGGLEDTWFEPPADLYQITTSPEEAPDRPTYVEVHFEKGAPVKLNNKSYRPVRLLEELNEIAGRNGIGRTDIIENRLVGIKSRGVYECPGGTVLFLAHRELESITLERELAHYKEVLAERYAELVYYGQWFSPLREALNAFMEKTQETVTGNVRMRLYKGNCICVGRKSPDSLYSRDLSTFEEGRGYEQKDAEGFIKLFGLPLKLEGMRHRRQS